MHETLSDEEWAKFFELMDKIVGGPGSYQEKRKKVVEQSEEQGGCDSSLEEFIGWFNGALEDEPTPTE